MLARSSRQVSDTIEHSFPYFSRFLSHFSVCHCVKSLRLTQVSNSLVFGHAGLTIDWNWTSQARSGCSCTRNDWGDSSRTSDETNRLLPDDKLTLYCEAATKILTTTEKVTKPYARRHHPFRVIEREYELMP
ncbi:hypothetical protein EMCRGX_G009679 [Ephydatia muelleri]